MTRLEFLRSLVGIGAGVVGLRVLAACGTDADPRPGDPNPGPDGGTAGEQSTVPDAGTQAPMDGASQPLACMPGVVIGSNHGHVMVVAESDLDSSSTRTYQIQGTSDHPHIVTITPAQFGTLRANRVLMTVSSNDDNHTHSITVRCAS